ncbi:thermonuclease family protein [Sphingomonas aerophila]|uniref:Endonuclease YncB(Thermonuclease family) n=1 Tax=Sphingomonas aerophila TaxID=1344948 RepID=A0A7W9EW17_9SPHN|nr:endonuclease YncB(thermonuclease family) [Sphingomonas aerophila]
MSFNRPFRAIPIQLGEHYRAKERRKRLRFNLLYGLLLGAAALIGGLIGIVSTADQSGLRPGYDDVVSGCTVTDGDTIRCSGERIRLLGIDAPEFPGHCRSGRVCAPGDPYVSKASLERAMVGSLRINRFGQDRYGRTLAAVSGDRGDLSCYQLEHSHAIYKSNWDNARRIARTCPSAALF